MPTPPGTPEARSLRVVVIGGAGFVGSHLVDALIAQKYQVRVLDNLDHQVHPTGLPPSYLNPNAEFVHQDVREINGLRHALKDADAVYYLAGAVGVGDSMYRIRHYADVNLLGCSNFLDILANSRHSIRKVILASSVTVYGEGKCICPKHGAVSPPPRSNEQVAPREWDPLCPAMDGKIRCAKRLSPLPTDEDKPLSPQSIYAITKRTQEELFLAVGHSYGIPLTVLRYFNIFGPRQAASNSYTGVAKIFALQLSQGKVPVIYEDGLQTRDFIHVSDVTQANLLALSRPQADFEILNVGTGRPCTILELADALAVRFNKKVSLQPTGQFRVGDVRHCFADISRVRSKLGFEPRTLIPEGLEDLHFSALSLDAIPPSSADAELRDRGLIR